MVDRHGRLSFCNDAYLDIHRLARDEIKPNMPLDEVLSLRTSRGTFDEATANFAKDDELTSECVRDLDDGRAVMVSRHRLPGGGWVSTYANFTEQRNLAKQFATTKVFLESVIDNIPVCVAVKDIANRRYVLANRAFEQFSRLSRDVIVGSTAEEIFTRESARAVTGADNEAIASANGDARMEIIVDRGSQKRVLAARRVVTHDGHGEPELLVTLFDDITEKRSLSKEVEQTKKFLELVLDNIPVSVMVKSVRDRRYLLVNRSGERFMNKSREQMVGQRVDDVHDGDEATFIKHRDDTALRLRGTVVAEEYPVKTDGGHAALSRPSRRGRRSAMPEPEYIVQTNEDVTDRRQTESRMAHMAFHDGLTDLPNRVAFVPGARPDDRSLRRFRRIRGRLDRSRSLQGDQRRVRPRRRRPAAGRGVAAIAGRDAGRGARPPQR